MYTTGIGLKVLALAPLAAALDVPDVSGAGWERIGTIGLLVLAVAAIWKDSANQRNKAESLAREREERLLATIAGNTTALTEVRDAMYQCKAREWDGKNRREKP